MNMVTTVIPREYPQKRFCLFSPQIYCATKENSRTVFIGIRRRFSRRWDFYWQSYLHAQFAGPQYQEWQDQRIKYLRRSPVETFPVPLPV